MIAGAEVWEGEVRVAGVVIVTKSGSLTLRPGTRVLFERIDRDGDGIGDAELFVEGELVAVGTPARPILLSSAAAEPRAGDWKYLYLDYARRGEIAHLISEYAFSGLQVHFCRATVRDSLFRRNVDGVRFSTANLELSGSRLVENTHGLRYEERRGVAHVHHNEIRDNEIGIFVVTRATGGTQLEYNNIVGNRAYAVKLGADQRADVTFPRNWWGGAAPDEIAAGFFDGRRDPALGLVHAPEPLPEPVPLRDHPKTKE